MGTKSIIDVYEDVLTGKLPRFPKGTWNYLSDAVRVLRYVIEEKEHISEDNVLGHITRSFMVKWKLYGMFKKVFHCSPYAVVQALYGDKHKPWLIGITPQGYWTNETGLRATQWLIEEELEWNDEQIRHHLSYNLFLQYNLGGMLNAVYLDSPYQAINALYPDRFRPWEFSSSPQNTWNDVTALKALHWLFEEKLEWTETDIREKLSTKTFEDNGLNGLLRSYFKGSPFKALDTMYPSKFKPWELNMAPINYWDKENSIGAIKWLIENKLKWSHEDVAKKMSLTTFQKHGIISSLKHFGNSPYRAINEIYPNKWKPWEFKMSPRNTWSEKTAKEAMVWLVEHKLGWTYERALVDLKYVHLVDYGISSILSLGYYTSFKKLLNDAYGRNEEIDNEQLTKSH